MVMGKLTAGIRLADEVWIATALLHRERPDSIDFSLKEIEERLLAEGLTESARRGVYPHISTHCVANRPRDRARYRMLFETAPSRRRLFRDGDPYDRGREGGKVTPRRSEIPPGYHVLLDWYEQQYAPATSTAADPLQDLASRYRDLWKGVNPDAYVRDLREGFE